MRIKLRLYLRDLDLIILKQHKHFNLNTSIRQALCDYVRNGSCDRVFVPDIGDQQFVLKNEQTDITFNNEQHQDVIEWILSIRPGMRSSAIKTVIRSAIANPVISPFMSNSDLVMLENTEGHDKTKSASNRPPERESATSTVVQFVPTAETKSTPTPSPWDKQHNHANTGDDDEIDLLEIDFENY